MSTAEAVKQYYEHNTRRLLAWGGGRKAVVIHREVWGPGVSSKDEAFNYCHHLILERLPDTGRSIHVLDLGCGVGSSLFYLCEHFDGLLTATGVTISPKQVQVARQRSCEFASGERCTFVEADFTVLPELEPADVIYSIEAFVHAPDPAAYLNQAAQVLAPGGKLYLIDDFLEEEVDNKYVQRFKEGWRLGSLVTVDHLEELAATAGLKVIENLDLTSWLNLGRPRDRFLKAVFSVPGISKLLGVYLRALDGGDALQTCLKDGWVRYRLIGLHSSGLRRPH